MGPVTAFMPKNATGRALIAPCLLIAALAVPGLARGQAADFDFGDGRHGSFIVSPGETTIQDLWSQVRKAADPLAYNPSNGAQVPQLENLTIRSGARLTTSAYSGNASAALDPTLGGILRVKVRGTLTIEAGGEVSVTGKGFRGGTLEGSAPGYIGQQGDSWGNTGGISGENNRGGGGGGFGEVGGNSEPGSGGGGGHREAGAPGATGTGTNTGGLGGVAFETAAAAAGQGFRDAYPFPRFGSGGGRGGQTANFANVLALGGNGGGVIIIEAERIVNNGAIHADGAAGGSNLSGGGGGAGGSVLIQSLSAANGTVTATGGAGGVGTVLGNDGGAGGSGILLWDARFELETVVQGQGTITLSPSGGRYDDNTVVSATAVPADGWMFARWEGGLSGSENPSDVTMDNDKSITAVFVALPTLTVSPLMRDVGPAGGLLDFTVTVAGGTGAIDWSTAITSGADFLTLNTGATGTNNGTITLTAAPNPTETMRMGTLEVASADVGSEPVTLTITQGPATPVLVVSPAEQTASAEGEDLVIQVRNAGTGSITWTAAILAGHSFASITSATTGTNDGTFVVAVSENLSPAQRIIRLSVSAPGAFGSPAEVTIVQLAGVPFLQVSPSSQFIGSASGTAAISVANGGSGSLGWTAAVVEGAEFATISSGASGVNGGQVSVAFQENTSPGNRTATIRVESPDAGNSPVEVTITQTAQASVLQVSPESQTVGSSAGTASFQVQNTGSGAMNWTASVVTGANFISITTGLSGTNAGAVGVAVAANTTATERSGTIRIDAPGAANSPVVVTLTQAARAPVLRIAPTEQSVGSGGGNVSITVENGGTGSLNWTASIVSGAEFLSLTPPSNGVGDGLVQVAVAANAIGIPRTGTIRVEAAGASESPQIATIVQLGCKVLDAPINVAASDGTYPDSVELIWSATPGAVTYEIFRGLADSPDRFELIGTSTEPRYSDLLAKAPTYELINRGCLNPGEFVIHNVRYYYEVRAVDPCGASERSSRTSGYRGLPLAGPGEETGEVVAEVLPSAKALEGAHLIQHEARVALRLQHASGIDPESIWVLIDGVDADPLDYFWRPVSEGDNRDGWIVFTGVDALPEDAVAIIDAGATALDGSELVTSASFYRQGGVEKAAVEGALLVPYLPENEDVGLFKQGLGVVFQIAPAEVYDAPQLIAVPVPDHADADALTLYFLSDEGDGGAWYPAERVQGWLAAPISVSDDGTHLEVWVNHGGTVRLGLAPVRDESAAIPGDFGTMILIGATALLFWVLGRRRVALRNGVA